MKKSFIVIFLFFFSNAYAQQINQNWNKDLEKELALFMACRNEAATGINPCNSFVGNALRTVYRINDFYSKELGRHMLVSEISQYLQQNSQWTQLGRGYEQKALIEAQNQANAGKAVVAVYLNPDGIGHISLILPGELKPSGTWGFQVPNSASFFLSTPEKSYIGKGLSYAYERPLLKGVQIYVRNY
jgi:hypothetical protein